MIELAQRALARCPGEAQVTVTSERSLVSRFARSGATQATSVEDTDVQFACLLDGQVGTATTNTLTDDGLRDAAQRARAAAEAAARSGGGDYPGLPAPAAAPKANTGHDPPTAELDPDAAGGALAAAFDACRPHQAFGIWTAGEVQTALASTSGLSVVERITDAHVKVICRRADGRTGYAAATAVSSADLDPTAVARRAAAKLSDVEPVDLPPGDYPVVLDHEAVGVLLEFLGWLAFNGLAHAEQRGALTDRLGQRVAAPNINLADSPRHPRTLPRAFDAEGVLKTPLPLIQDGVAHRVVHDTRSAAIAGGGARSTGHAPQVGGSADGPAPTNLVLAGGGAASIDALAAPITRGIYVTRLWYVNPVEPRRALLTGMTRDGTFLIEDGRISRPLRDVRFTDSALRILAATQELTAGQRLVSEAEFYGRRFASGVVCPALRADGFRITASTA